jgi:hypothetical protein
MGISDFIEELNHTDRYIHHIYSKGGCYKFHILLSKMYKGCIPYTNGEHIITRYKGKYYDIYCEVDNQDGFRKLLDKEIPTVSKWSFYMNNLLVLKDCPHCDEAIIIKNLTDEKLY